MKIKNLELAHDLVLAPLAGFTDIGFRAVCKRHGAALTYTEMVSAKGLVYGGDKTRELLAVHVSETPVAVQIFGSDPVIMGEAAAHEALAGFDLIDINMGCPVPKIVKNGEGSALLKDVSLAAKVVEAVVRGAGERPVSVKFRKGFALSEDTAVEFGLAMQAAGASAVAVHGRTREQYYGGAADWQSIARVKDAVSIPVFANGDIKTRADYLAVKSQTCADGVMIGRAALGNPGVFRELRGLKKEERSLLDIRMQIEILLGHYPEKTVVNMMKKHICYYAAGIPGSKPFKQAICLCNSVLEMLQQTERFFAVDGAFSD